MLTLTRILLDNVSHKTHPEKVIIFLIKTYNVLQRKEMLMEVIELRVRAQIARISDNTEKAGKPKAFET